MMGSCTLPPPKAKTVDRITFTQREVEIQVQRQVAAETRIFSQQLDDWTARNRNLRDRLVQSELESAAFIPALNKAFALVNENGARIDELTAEIARLARECRRRPRAR